ncbi:MAG: S4 domain-containing protein [Pseudomonadota bacterium]
MDTLSFTLGAPTPPRLDKALARFVPEGAISRSRLARFIAKGHVTVNGQTVTDQKAKVIGGEVIEITLPPAQDSDMQAEAIPLDIRYEDDDLIVVNKPAGMVVHPAPGSPRGTLVTIKSSSSYRMSNGIASA